MIEELYQDGQENVGNYHWFNDNIPILWVPIHAEIGSGAFKQVIRIKTLLLKIGIYQQKQHSCIQKLQNKDCERNICWLDRVCMLTNLLHDFDYANRDDVVDYRDQNRANIWQDIRQPSVA
jgi:hypothetical protein